MCDMKRMRFTKQADLNCVFTTYYKAISNCCTEKRINIDLNDFILVILIFIIWTLIFSKEEVVSALNEMSSVKSSGIDGFPTFFLKKIYAIFKA